MSEEQAAQKEQNSGNPGEKEEQKNPGLLDGMSLGDLVRTLKEAVSTLKEVRAMRDELKKNKTAQNTPASEPSKPVDQRGA